MVNFRNSLEVQWLSLRTSDAGGVGLIPGRETNIPQATWPKQNNEIKCLCHLIPDFAAAAVAGKHFSSPQDAQKSVGDTSSNWAKMHCTLQESA